MEASRPPGLSRWLLAIRPATLPAAIAPVLVGTAAAEAAGTFDAVVFAVILSAALLIQIGTNLANDVFDFQKGADTASRLGPPRATQMGLITPAAMKRAMFFAFASSAVAGAYLISIGGWPIAAIGVASIAAGVTYTGGPWPYGYHGLGDPFVFVFFGLVAVTGTYYLQAGAVSSTALVAALPVGFLVTAILVINNLRDLETDRAARKRTLAVRIGDRATRLQYCLLVGGAYAVGLALWLFGSPSAALLPWLTLPLAWGLMRRVWAGAAGGELNPVLKRTAGLHLLFGVLLSAGLALGS